jgi:hypothetical protein
MENIIEKLKLIKSTKHAWDDWSLEEVRALFEIYFVISKKEAQIFDLIYQYHGCDSWEDIFRDYSPRHLKDKADGVEVAIIYYLTHSSSIRKYYNLLLDSFFVNP